MSDCSVAIVTGGGGGLGLVIAEDLSDRGYRTVVFDVSEERLSALDSSRHYGMKVDVLDEEQVLQAVKKVNEELGIIKVLVNNAGTIFSAPLVNIMDPNQRRHNYKQFSKIVEINLNAAFLVGSVVAEAMVMHRTAGTIINISSISAQGNIGQSAYAAAKAGVEAMTKVWCKELGVFGIRTAAIAPGFMDTSSTRTALPEQKICEIIGETPLRRLGNEHNVSKAVLSVIDNDFISGAIIAVDGGMTI